MYYEWRPYVSAAQRRANAAKAMQARAKKGLEVDPVTITGRKIATTFWGERWCAAMEAEADFENRLPRGRTYARNGSVVHLAIAQGSITAAVSGSELYDVTITVKALPAARWSGIRRACGAGVSALALLQGRLDDAALRALTAPGAGMIPEAGDFKIRCSCPDWASLCKHAAAVLYGVGARLDRDPALLFTLRGVDMNELVAEAGSAFGASSSSKALAADSASLAATFGIDLDDAPAPAPAKAPSPKTVTSGKPSPKKTTPKKPAAKKPAAKKPAAKASTPAGDGAAVAAGLYSTAQLRALGVTPTRLRRLRDAGVVAVEGFGWYRVLRALAP